MSDDMLKNIDGTLKNIAEILNGHFNPPKKIKWDLIITYLVLGIAGIISMFLLNKMLRPLYFYNF